MKYFDEIDYDTQYETMIRVVELSGEELIQGFLGALFAAQEEHTTTSHAVFAEHKSEIMLRMEL